MATNSPTNTIEMLRKGKATSIKEINTESAPIIGKKWRKCFLSIEGRTLQTIRDNENLEKLLKFLLSHCQHIVGFLMSAQDKEYVIDLIRSIDATSVVAAVGDGKYKRPICKNSK